MEIKINENLKRSIYEYLYREFYMDTDEKDCNNPVDIDDDGLIGIAFTEKYMDEVEHLLDDKQLKELTKMLPSLDYPMDFQVSFEVKTLKVLLHINYIFIKEHSLHTTDRAIRYFDNLDFDGAICW